MTTTKAAATHRPLDDLERFEIMQAMFPDEISDDNDAWDNIDDIIWDKFEIDAENFDDLVGRLVMLAPVMSSPLTNTVHHTLGRITIADGQQNIVAAVKRDAVEAAPIKSVADECDHDWDDMGNGTMACTYPECAATRAKRPEDEEAAQ